MQIPPSSIIFFIVCGIPLFFVYFIILRKVKGFFWRSLGITLLFLLLILAFLIVVFISKDWEPITS